MDVQFFDNPNQIPKSRHEIVIEGLKATPYPDRFRVFIEITVTPFQDRPNLLVSAYNRAGRLVGEMSIIETMHAKMEFTMHIRNIVNPEGEYTLSAELFYDNRNPPQDRKVTDFSIPAGSE